MVSKRLRVFLGMMILTAASAALASGAGPITGYNGHAATCLFDSDDIGALSEWSGYAIEVGSTNFYAGKTTIAADENGMAYTYVRGQGSDYYDAVVGIVAGNGSSLSTIYYNPYDGSGDWDMPSGLAIAPFSVGSGDARIDSGDIVMLCSTLRDYGTQDERYGTLIQAFDPADAEGTLRDLYYTEDFTPGGYIFLDPTTGSIVIPRGNSIEHIAFDADDGAFVRTTGTNDVSFGVGGSIWAMDAAGDLYTDKRFTDPDTGKNDYRVIRLDGTNGDLLDDAYADPKGAPNNYANHKMGGFTFDSAGKFWLADWKKKKSPSHFISKMNNKGSFPYGKRVAGWDDGSDREMKTLQIGLDDVLYAIVQDHPGGRWAVWAID
jgi:hypothetical protein